MATPRGTTRRQALLAAAAAPLVAGASAARAEAAGKVYRIGVISAAIRGKPQPRNGHTWHFAQYLHPEINLEAIKKYLDPGSVVMFSKYNRNPKYSFDQLPFPDTRITHYYDADPTVIGPYLEAFPGVKAAKSPEDLAAQVDAVWLGDASGFGEDHLDLIAPALKRGLPTFCDKPIGETVAGTRAILEFARKHKAPLMSSSLFRHEWGTEAAIRKRDTKEFGPIRYVIAGTEGGYSPDRWAVYGQHPAWTVVTLLGPGAKAVSMYAREDTSHALVTYPDRMPAEIWTGRPSERPEYNHTTVFFEKKRYEYTPSIEGDFWYGHHYQMFRMAATFREMVKTGREPIPHEEILAVTAIIRAGAKSLTEKSRLVELAEVSEG
ncbi:MAG: gfo/Idh/MocA family oxidoreductase [Gemmataceae bacterium]|nr:gfo/Idh/MocA family oxidoreductase [Gemmataceae bacterium]